MGAIDNVITGLKKIRQISQELHDAELKNLIADLMFEVAELKTEMVKLSEENLKLRGEVQQLQQQRSLRSKVEFRDGLYYLTEAIEGLSQGPFCPTCWENDEKLITAMPAFENRTQRNRSGRLTSKRVRTGWQCRRCEQKRVQ